MSQHCGLARRSFDAAEPVEDPRAAAVHVPHASKPRVHKCTRKSALLSLGHVASKKLVDGVAILARQAEADGTMFDLYPALVGSAKGPRGRVVVLRFNALGDLCGIARKEVVVKPAQQDARLAHTMLGSVIRAAEVVVKVEAP
eukprot:1711544-Prymnesium_polylepis.1